MFDQSKWQKMCLTEQMGNIGSEVSKAFYWREKDKKIGEETAERALELFDLTISDRGRRFNLGEILKMRSVFCDCFFELGNFVVRPEAIKNYFLPFALLAQQEKCKYRN